MNATAHWEGLSFIGALLNLSYRGPAAFFMKAA
jgi:hypothetical protein